MLQLLERGGLGVPVQRSYCAWTAPRTLIFQTSVAMQSQVFNRLVQFSVFAPALSGVFTTIFDFLSGLLSSLV